MNSERWQRVQRLFEEALAQPAANRRAFILSACGGETELRDELFSLLAAHERGGKTEEVPAAWLGALGATPMHGAEFAKVGQIIGRMNAALSGRYVIQRELGAGGMATVFLADDLRHRRRVAIKVLREDVGAVIGRERFLREIEIAAGLNHPHILPVYDSGVSADLLYYVMPHAEGESLRERLGREKQLAVEEAIRIVREIADALDYAHRRGVVHRDIKPENILLQEGHAVVADFGIARAVVATGSEKLTKTGVVIGTPVYMSPEQHAGGPDLDGRADLYALGCVLYEMLAGQAPFIGPTAVSITYQHLNVPARPVTDLRPTVSATITRAIQRALAKTPADRFTTAAEFAAALVAEAGREVPPPPPQPRPPRWKRLVIAATSAAAIALVGFAAWRFFNHEPTPGPAKKAWILVAEFDGPADDSSLAVTTRDLVSAALDQSDIVATVPRQQIRLALQNAGKPASTRVDAELARELAYRSAVRTVVEGKIGRLGPGYSVVLRVVDADSAKVVLTETAVAKNQDALIPALGRLAKKLRVGLGEEKSAIQATRPLYDVATPSFEAYRLFVRAQRLLFDGSPRQSVRICRDALALDRDFASAWMIMAYDFYNLRQPDSSLAAFDEMLRRAHRMTEVGRLFAEASRSNLMGDLITALATYDQILQRAPGNPDALVNRSIIVASLGRFDEALENVRAAMRATPFGPTLVARVDEIWYLIYLGRLDEARDATRYLSGDAALEYRTWVALAATDWPLAESLSTARANDPRLFVDAHALALLHLASAQAGRGALRTAGATLERAEALTRAEPELVSYQSLAERGRLVLAVLSRGATPLPEDAWATDTSMASLLNRGLRAAIAGDRATASRLLGAARARPPRELIFQGAAPALLEAWIASLEGQWSKTAQLLAPLARQPVEIGQVDYPAGLSLARWLLADAFERLGQPDSAAVYLEKVVSGPGSDPVESQLARGAAWSLTHHRLVLLYARLGRIEDAQRHWQVFTASVRTPDAEMQPMIAEARAALASAEGVVRSARR